VEQPRHRLHAGISQRLRQEEVARLEERGEDDGEPVLAARADDDVVGSGGDAGAGDPGRPRLPVGGVAPGRRVVEQAARVGAGGEAPEGGEERRALRLGPGLGRVVLAEVDDGIALLRLDAPLSAAHERSPAHLSGHEAPARRLGVRPADRSHGHAEPVGQLPMGRYPVALAERPGRESLREVLDDGQVPRPIAAFDARHPDCHGDNIVIDTMICQL